MKSLGKQIVILLFKIFLATTTLLSQSEQNPLDEFMHMILVSDSIKTNISNKVNIFVSKDHKIYTTYKKKDEVDINSICSLIDNNSIFPVAIIISCEKSVKFKFYKQLVNQLKECVQYFLDDKSNKHYSSSFSKLDSNQKQFIKVNYAIFIFDSDY